jgi:DNA helicase IV
MLYARLDELLGRTTARLSDALREQVGGSHQLKTEREASVGMYTERQHRLRAAEYGLCFGRLDLDDSSRRYIGRHGLFTAVDHEPLLIDWRAPAARPFYLATAASPHGVRRRRHIRTDDRTVVGLDDEVLDLTAVDAGGREDVTGEAALLAAINASRTGRMSDIVETIQAEQDRIISSDHQGVLVVEGGPGTGKTAVALHRAAYLLYTHRHRLSRSGVLIVGPNTTFLRYIGQVLPSLGETGVLLATIGELYPGVAAERVEPAAVAEVKGRPAMADVLAAAVRDRQVVPDEAMDIVVDHYELRLDRAVCEDARDTARRSGLLHNEARTVFAGAIVDALTRQVAERIGADILGGPNLLDTEDIADIRRDLAEDRAVQGAIDDLWPTLTPQRLLTDLYADAGRLESAGAAALLRRDPGGGWTPADVPLLDEAAELLGPPGGGARARAELDRRARIAEAQDVLDILSGSLAHEMDDDTGPEALTAHDVVTAEQLAERHAMRIHGTVAERAAADRTWAFGHVIVDEAQELSAMAWRMLMRRSPNRSMTLVGDVHQTSDLAGTSSWEQVLAPYVADRWRLERLTVNYRTPSEVMDVAAAFAPGSTAPRSVRSTGISPWRSTDDVTEAIAAEVAAIGDGRLGVIVPSSRLRELGGSVSEYPDLEKPVVVVSVRQAKGLEFDSVLVVDPDRILAESPRGRNDLYVALTRATQRLGVLHTGDLPAGLDQLTTRTLSRHG